MGWAAEDSRLSFPPQDLRSSNDEITYISSYHIPDSISYSLQLQGMDDSAPFLFHYTSAFVYLLLKGWGHSRINSLPHSSMPFDTFSNKDNLHFFPKIHT